MPDPSSRPISLPSSRLILPMVGAGPARPAATPEELAIPPLLRLGFRPFFLLAAFLASGWIPLWLLEFTGRIHLPLAKGGSLWHGHELIFGFAAAVLAGFLLTAVRNWTSQPTPIGRKLLLLAVLWSAGRLVMLGGGKLPIWLVAGIDGLFLPVLATSLAIPIVRSKNWRNLGFLILISALTVANLTFHLGSGLMASRALQVAVGIFILIITVMGGRIIPVFTQNATAGMKVTPRRWLDWAAFASTALVVLYQSVGAAPQALLWPALLAGVLHTLRMAGWGGWRTLTRPLLWVLHLGYASIPVGFFLYGLLPLVPRISPTAPLHAHTVGAISILCLGMMARVSLGHTGRVLEPPRTASLAFILLGLTLVVRVLLPIFLPVHYLILLWIAAFTWSLSFLLFLFAYWPILSRPRVDGRAG